ncbi:hypothetical protein T05_13741 [Trichinella murrelli]|uniref:Uncharacterized protein n=1 Tax=Trichinella murrelli TaxID=144512 RepID=A0A0V0T7H0_9BILA|nr:hypothetical protein T05_13741 [Trichinella murrelli]
MASITTRRFHDFYFLLILVKVDKSLYIFCADVFVVPEQIAEQFRMTRNFIIYINSLYWLRFIYVLSSRRLSFQFCMLKCHPFETLS